MTQVAGKPAKRGRPRDAARIAKQKERILYAAARCFGEKGYAKTDVEWIAESLGLTKGTLYHYFGSKEALFFAAVDAEASRLREHVLAAADACGDPLDELCAAVYAYLALFEANPHVVELFIEERSNFKDRKKHTYFIHRDQTLPRWHRCVKQLIEEGRFLQVDPERTVSVLTDVLYGTIFTNYFAGAKQSAAEQAGNILNVTLNGLLVEPLTDSERRALMKRLS